MDLQKAIESECHKLISRYGKRLATDRDTRQRFTKATGEQAASPKKLEPDHWAISHEFNPFLVRPRAKPMARAIEAKILAKTYTPRPALVLQAEKPTGGTRPISIFAVADAAVAGVYYKRILKRNQSRISPFSYAYRSDLNAHAAIERLTRLLRESGRLYLVEFDFSKYFDTIKHSYLLQVLRTYFRVTNSETALIKAMLSCPRAFGAERYQQGEFLPTVRGIPQGNSLSLFLANVACHELDLALSREGITFVRYADDVLMACDTEFQAGKGLDHIISHCSRAGLSVNFKKSDGISEFTPAALRPSPRDGSKSTFDFVGHRFSFNVVNKRGQPAPVLVRRTGIRDRTIAGIKKKLSNIIYSHLLRYPRKGKFKPERISQNGIDWDLVTCINDLRGYVYGGMLEDDVRRALADRTERLHLSRGVMAFFPLIDDVVQLKKLDGWLVSALASAICRRKEALSRHRLKTKAKKFPLLSAKRLLEAKWYKAKKPKIKNDVRIPSFVRAWKYARKGLLAFNLQQYPTRRGPDPEVY